MRGLLGCLPLQVSLVYITVTGANDQVKGVYALSTEGEMKWIVTKLITL